MARQKVKRHHLIFSPEEASALPELLPRCLLAHTADPLFHKPEQYEDLKQLFCQIDRHAVERESGYRALCQYLMLAALELVKRKAQRLPFSAVRIGVDAVSFLAGAILGGTVGIGTIVSVVLTGPAIQLASAAFAHSENA